MVKKQSVRFRLIAYPILLIFFAIIAYLVATSAMGITLKYENGKLIKEKTGSIILASSPGDATVYVNENRYASKTPFIPFLTMQLSKLRQGSYTIKLEKENFVTWEGVFKVYPGLVTWGTHILMLPEKKEFTPYNLSSSVKYVITSRDSIRELVVTHDETNNVIAVNQVQTAGKQSVKLFEKRLAADEMYQPIMYSSDKERILFEKRTGQTKSYVVFEAKQNPLSWDVTDTFRVSFDSYLFNPANHDELYGLRAGDLYRIGYVEKNLSGVLESSVLGMYLENQNLLFAQKVEEKNNLYRLGTGDRKDIVIRNLPKSEAYKINALSSDLGFTILATTSKELFLYPAGSADVKPKPLASNVTMVLPSPEFEFIGYLEGGDFKCYELTYGRTYTALAGRKLASIAWFEDEFNLTYIENGKLKMVTYSGSYDKEIGTADNGFPVVTSPNDPIIYFVAQNKEKNHTDLFVFDFKR